LNKPTLVAIGLGSNLGDRHAHLMFARDQLAAVLTNFRLSSIHETLPVDVPDVQPVFLNAAAIGETTLGAREFLSQLLDIERARGRERPFPSAARVLDLDLVLFGDVVLDEPGLTIPHPRFRERRFVLEPLAELAPAWRDPVTLLTVVELLARLPPPQRVQPQ
jgi:2-amino-4-hydroxy-6-hydroxymethyldihydropteridine diphosphokinase